MRLRRDFYAILTIAYREILKALRDPARIITTLTIPFVLVIILGNSFQANIGQRLPYNYLTYTFTGVFAQTLFQSMSLGMISLIEDRENDFHQELFVAPISRYSIMLGKLFGELFIAAMMIIGLLFFGLLTRVPLIFPGIVALLLTALIVCLLGGAFGLMILSSIKSQRAANQIITFFLFPQLFLAGVFTPIQQLPWYLDILSRLSPLRYAVDLVRAAFYSGSMEYSKVVLTGFTFDLFIISILFLLFFCSGTILFVRSEHNR